MSTKSPRGAISTATRQIVTNITKNLTKVISGLFGKK